MENFAAWIAIPLLVVAVCFVYLIILNGRDEDKPGDQQRINISFAGFIVGGFILLQICLYHNAQLKLKQSHQMGQLIHKQDLHQVTSIIQFVHVIHDKRVDLYHEVNGGIYNLNRISAMQMSLQEISEAVTNEQLLYR